MEVLLKGKNRVLMGKKLQFYGSRDILGKWMIIFFENLEKWE